jgi:hypothetical protein
MGKISEALTEQQYKECVVAKIIRGLDPEDMDAVKQAIDRKVSGYFIAGALRSDGIEIADSTVGRHVRKACLCFKEK